MLGAIKNLGLIIERKEISAEDKIIRELLLFTTVAQKLNQGTLPKTGGYRFRLVFLLVFGDAKSKIRF